MEGGLRGRCIVELTAKSGQRVERILRNMSNGFLVSFDQKAQQWLAEHPSEDALVIAYQDTRC